ncbi:MAG: hypothetical protein ACXW5W_17595 [Candidatus Binatia bacterium]
MAVTDYKGPAFDSSELKELKEKVVNGCLILDREAITDGFGHVSVRIPVQSAFSPSPRSAPAARTSTNWFYLTSTETFSAALNRRPTSGRFMPASCARARMS